MAEVKIYNCAIGGHQIDPTRADCVLLTDYQAVRDRLTECETALKIFKHHDDDCEDQHEEFADNQCCECGATMALQYTEKYGVR